MTLTGDLVEEHKLIKRMIDMLESFAKKLEEGQIVEPIIFEQATDFIRNFADRFHHAKEEDILFKEMVKKGMPEKDSPIEVMLIEHEQGRDFVKGIIRANEQLKRGDKRAIKEIIRNAKGYIELLREHIEKENDILYPLAERMFTQEEQKELYHKFKEAETKKGGELTVKKYEGIVIIFEMSEIANRNLPASARSKRAMLRSKASGTAIAVSEHAQKHATCFSTGSVFDTKLNGGELKSQKIELIRV